MAFIRRVRTASGATAVQVTEYVAGRRRILEHVGSAHTEAELGVLLERARELLQDPAQGVLDLCVEPTPTVKELVPATGDQRVSTPAVPAPPQGRASPARVVGTDPPVLLDALAGVFTVLGFDALGDEVFRDLVIARVVEPTSLLDAGRVLRDLSRDPASYSAMKRTLVRAEAAKYRDRIAGWCFQHATAAGDVSLVLYDVTTLLRRHWHRSVYTDLMRSAFSIMRLMVRRPRLARLKEYWSTIRCSRASLPVPIVLLDSRIWPSANQSQWASK
ncbi:hypothetical protein AB5L97_12175 [Sinomonas sp. P10A9]|uniref:Transposase n=1 Tax=Sinomonas puerhi TaxID=3238584 RepID=A0AB39KYW4_9MICC